MNIALCFCVRNCEKYLHDIFLNIENLKTLNINVFSIFVYDNCIDNSQYILEKYQLQNCNNVIVRNIENTSQSRTVRIAKARNCCLEIVYNELNDIMFHIMIDCDDICCLKWDIDIIYKYLNNFDNDNWDCISFNRNKYYDIWALMFDNFKHHCWGFEHSDPAIDIMRATIINKLNNCETNSIEVFSAFCGFCIYKTDKFKGLFYDGLYCNVKPLITSDELNNTLQTFEKEYNVKLKIKETIECCEHIFYHLNALKKGCKIKISKFKIM